ncbi:uncharacterized protein FIESC28_02081 [Fusarium coffeatum]|uniref:Uncharacterized protein n=1 Tax=Fusarium coffeatum TaxID=231269 RepID=A0A366S763_9HYPO|nr:uncharacterized protein FIESC28_02081 [Fusarium coffeatum]RBR25173.1 hypothetical protein FIESC28_02081 [Fusarium coffeatum]
MSPQQKRSREAMQTSLPNKRQNKGPATSDTENSSSMDEELPSQGYNQCLSPTLSQHRAFHDNCPSHGSMESDALSSSAIHPPSGLWSPPTEPPLDRLDRIERAQGRLRAGLDALQSLVASRSVVNKSATWELHARVQALEREAKSPSYEAILAENGQLRRSTTILERNLKDQARTLQALRQSYAQLYNQLVQANVKIASLQGGRV